MEENTIIMIPTINLGQHKQYVTTISPKPYSQNYTLLEQKLDHVAGIGQNFN
jgi:hypothetical protein